MNQDERKQRIRSLAQDIIRLSRNTLLVDLRFLDTAISRLSLQYLEEDRFAVDGRALFLGDAKVLKTYQESPQGPARAYLHMLFHCIFQHIYKASGMDPRLWNLSCDMAAEHAIASLRLRTLKTPAEDLQAPVIASLSEYMKTLSAEKIYQYYANKEPSREELAELEELFFCDDHSLWYPEAEESDEEDESHPGPVCSPGGSSGGSSGFSKDRPQEAGGLSLKDEEAKAWREIAERMEVELGSFAKEQGDTAGGLMQNLMAVNRQKYDYSAFLKKFAVSGEAMKLNPDEFDYIFYTYGLKLYKNVPLIEALEYKDVKKIRDFVIAIDTSGSTSGDLVQKFVEKTWNILQNEANFFTSINLHIIQCDAQIQEHVKITSKEQFEEYLKTMTLKGFGGTDFRPVFTMVDQLVKDGEFENLKGLIYFTDGYGEFPAKKPAYDTAFVFVEDDYNNPLVPSWAIKLVLQKDEI